MTTLEMAPLEIRHRSVRPISAKHAQASRFLQQSRSAYPLPQSAHHIPGSASSFSPTALFRTPLASDSARGGETLDQVKARRGTVALSHQVIDLVARKARRPSPEVTFALIEEFFDAGDAMPQPSLDGSASPDDPHQPPRY